MKLLISHTITDFSYACPELANAYHQHLSAAIRGTTPQGHQLFGFGLEEADGVICEVRGCPCCTRAGRQMDELKEKCEALNKPLVFVSPVHGFDYGGDRNNVLQVSKHPPFRTPGKNGEFATVEEWNAEFKQIYLQAVERLGQNVVAA